jgi:O-methyltransferase involved in polyketide biosynthesis
MDQKLRGLPETMLIPLWAKAVESDNLDPIIKDDKALEIIAGLDYDFSKFKKAWLSQLGVCIRTMLLDRATLDFLERKPGATVINLGAGLDTRIERIHPDALDRWYDLDLPETIDIRRRFFTESDRRRFISKSVFDFSWLDDIKPNGRPTLIIAEGLLMYFEEDRVKSFFSRVATELPGSEMLFEMLAPILVGKSGIHDSISQIDQPVEFKWGLKNSKTMETWHQGIRFIEEWNYFDYYKKRWKWFGFIARLPLIKPKLSNRIVHIAFK